MKRLENVGDGTGKGNGAMDPDGFGEAEERVMMANLFGRK